MQSDDALTKLGALDREMIEHRVRTIFERRAAGDLPGIVEYAAEDIFYNVQGNWTLYPFSRSARGKALLVQWLAVIEAMYENLGSTIHELVIDGERVALHRTSRMRNRGTGEVRSVDICDFLRFRDGLVIEFAEYPDSAAIARLDGPLAKLSRKISMPHPAAATLCSACCTCRACGLSASAPRAGMSACGTRSALFVRRRRAPQLV